MATINTKYSVGDAVYHAAITTEKFRHPCPDCNDTKKWRGLSPAGGEYEFPCPRCTARYRSDDTLSLDYSQYVPSVRRLTIGSVQYNSAPGHYDSGARYMCVETGVGGGSVYQEDSLFETEEAAQRAAEALAATSNKTTEWVVKQYDKSLSISDYQLDGGKIKLAKDQESRARSMLWNLEDLFGRIEEACDKEEILEEIENYKRWDWDRDKKTAADEIQGIRSDLAEIAADAVS